MATLDAKRVFIKVVNFYQSKPKSKQALLHSFPCLQFKMEMENKDQFYNT